MDKFIRYVLWFSAVFNLGGALMFAFPSSPAGKFAGLPTPVPVIYRILVALFVLLFGGAYAWLARQSNIDRPLLALGAIGKAGAFLVVFILWLLGEATGHGLLAVTGDLILAGSFTWWLLGSRENAPADMN
jgi:hypothetical protein